MQDARVHSFHIPVLGLAFSIDTPVRVARFGISSVVSIVDDVLVEHMRKKHAALQCVPFQPIAAAEVDSRARRITAYLDLLQAIVHRQMETLRASAFERGTELTRYFELLADRSPLKRLYERMTQTVDIDERSALQSDLRCRVVPGDIDVNIMTKVDKRNKGADHKLLPAEFSDALASLRGFAQSTLRSSVVLSAGLNQRLFSYLATRPEFAPDADGQIQKKVILKVTDFRSAYIQGKILAKKGIWISEFRVESGLNCGGHAFASDGYLLGPIMEEFRVQRDRLLNELHQLYEDALRAKGLPLPAAPLRFRVTVQGGIGTASEDTFLREYYQADGTGWGSPFLLVPEATNVDDATREKLSRAQPDDYYLSDASPLGIPFNNLRGSASEEQIRERIRDGRPGSPCTKKYLVSNTEFTSEPICTASRQYQAHKIRQLNESDLLPEEREIAIAKVVEKACLCEDLAAAAYTGDEPAEEYTPQPVAICPGPNLAYFSKIASLDEMVGHIYGRVQLITAAYRPNMFVNELRLYIDYLKREIEKRLQSFSEKDHAYFSEFRKNLQDGIAYYHALMPRLVEESERYRETMRREILELEEELLAIMFPEVAVLA